MGLLNRFLNYCDKREEQQYRESIEKGYKCRHCNKYLTLVLGKITEGRSIFCNHCGYRLIWEDNELKIAHKFNCPYCNEVHILSDGYYECVCGNSFRKETDWYKTNNCIITRSDETINDVILGCILILQKVALLSEIGNDGRFDFYKDLIISTFELNEKQIAWCQEKDHLKDRSHYVSISPTDERCIYGLGIIIEPFVKNMERIGTNKKDFFNIFCYLMLKIGYYDNKYQNFEKIEDEIKKCFQIDDKFYEDIKQEVLDEMGISTINIEIYFDILGLNSKANEEDIKKAYRQLVKKYHPDKYSHQNLSDTEMKKINEKFIKIQDAYEKVKEYI